MRRRIIALTLSIATLGFTAMPAQAFFGLGSIVLDPANLAENISTATNTVKQINNQVSQLQNEARMLINQAENLAELDFNAIQELQRILEQIDALMNEADEITYEVEESRRVYEEKYPESYEDLTNEEIVTHAMDQWRTSRNSFGHSIRVQSGIVSAIAESRDTLTNLVNESQSAPGALAVTQAGNQLAALGVEQQMQMQQLMAAHYRMMATEQARRHAIEEQGRVLHNRFRGDGSAYSGN